MAWVPGQRASALSVVSTGGGPLRLVTPREESEGAFAGANGPAETAPAPPGTTRTIAGPLRALTLSSEGDPAPAESKDERQTLDGPAATAGSGALEAVHGPTAKVVHHLRQARHRLQRAASPELQLSPAI